MGLDSIRLASSRISNYYHSSNKTLATSLTRISSGQKYLDPKDGTAEYMRIQRLRQDRRGYQDIGRGLARATALLNVAEAAGSQVVDSLKRMKEIAEVYHMGNATQSEKQVYELEYSNLVEDIKTIASNTSFDNRQLLQADTAITSLMLDPSDIGKKLEIKFESSDMVDTDGLSIGNSPEVDMQTIDEQMKNAMSYLSRTSGFLRTLQHQQDLVGAIVENGQAFESTIGGIDDGQEMSRLISQEIRQQASMSMLAHANNIRQGILKLIG